VRALFVENMSGPVLCMIGAKYALSSLKGRMAEGTLYRYNIEPFFFSSSLNWIPSRFQSDVREGTGDRMYLAAHTLYG
jgi:hypothetical protein